MICNRCGYSGPAAACSVCRGVDGTCRSRSCMRCGAYAEIVLLPEWVRSILLFVLMVAIAGAVAHLLCACGPEFRAADGQALSFGGADSGAMGGGAGVSAVAGGGAQAAAGMGANHDAAGPGGAGVARDCERAGWTLSAFASRADEPPSAALDGDPTTRWASGEPQAAGQWLELELGAPATLERLELRSAPGDMPAAIALELDGVAAVATPSMATPGVLDLELERPTQASHVRFVLVTPSSINWWSVLELTAVCR